VRVTVQTGWVGKGSGSDENSSEQNV
jgi:hypothetical protein